MVWKARWLVWWIYVALWTTGLLLPLEAIENLPGSELLASNKYLAAKSLHVKWAEQLHEVGPHEGHHRSALLRPCGRRHVVPTQRESERRRNPACTKQSKSF